MPDESLLTVSLPPADWQILQAALWELPMKIAAPVVQRLQAALAEAQKPAEGPHLRSVPSEGEE